MRFESLPSRRRTAGKPVDTPIPKNPKTEKTNKIDAPSAQENFPKRRRSKQLNPVKSDTIEKRESTKPSLDIEIKSTARKSFPNRKASVEHISSEDVINLDEVCIADKPSNVFFNTCIIYLH